jgi:hypothetical protein
VKAVVFYESADDEDTMKWLIPSLKTFISRTDLAIPSRRPGLPGPRDQS